MVVVVNEFLHGGCLEFLAHVELQEGRPELDKRAVDTKAATALMAKAEAERLEKEKLSKEDADELADWLAESGLADVAAPLAKVGVTGIKPLKRLNQQAFEKLLGEMSNANFNNLVEKVRGGLGHAGAPASAETLREAVAARTAEQAERDRAKQENAARLAAELSEWLHSAGLATVEVAVGKVQVRSGVQGLEILERLDEADFEVLLAGTSEADFNKLVGKLREDLGHEGAPASVPPLSAPIPLHSLRSGCEPWSCVTRASLLPVVAKLWKSWRLLNCKVTQDPFYL